MKKSDSEPWEAFTNALTEHFGTAQRAQTNFAENTNYGLSSLQHWRKSNRVPADAFIALAVIDPTKCQSSHFQGYHTQTFNKRVIDLSAQKKTLSEIADILSGEVSRKVTENMIKGIRYRHKDEIVGYQSRNL